MYKMKSRGLGDSIEKFTKFTGMQKRQWTQYQ